MFVFLYGQKVKKEGEENEATQQSYKVLVDKNNASAKQVNSLAQTVKGISTFSAADKKKVENLNKEYADFQKQVEQGKNVSQAQQQKTLENLLDKYVELEMKRTDLLQTFEKNQEFLSSNFAETYNQTWLAALKTEIEKNIVIKESEKSKDKILQEVRNATTEKEVKAIIGAEMYEAGKLQVLSNGNAFYDAARKAAQENAEKNLSKEDYKKFSRELFLAGDIESTKGVVQKYNLDWNAIEASATKYVEEMKKTIDEIMKNIAKAIAQAKLATGLLRGFIDSNMKKGANQVKAVVAKAVSEYLDWSKKETEGAKAQLSGEKAQKKILSEEQKSRKFRELFMKGMNGADIESVSSLSMKTPVVNELFAKSQAFAFDMEKAFDGTKMSSDQVKVGIFRSLGPKPPSVEIQKVGESPKQEANAFFGKISE
ncbi:MAG: hypothetical protein WC506_04100 [Candidatus Micrarchaeia archaeon]